eukprot:scaffold81175_cov63-Phaeocystis_antarctica.AAC.1
MGGGGGDNGDRGGGDGEGDGGLGCGGGGDGGGGGGLGAFSMVSMTITSLYASMKLSSPPNAHEQGQWPGRCRPGHRWQPASDLMGPVVARAARAIRCCHLGGGRADMSAC